MRPMEVAPRLVYVLGLIWPVPLTTADQVLARNPGGEDFGVAGLLSVNEQGDEPNDGYSGKNEQNYLFHARYVLRVSPDSVRNCRGCGSQQVLK